MGKKMLAAQKMYMHALSGKARHYRDNQLIDVEAYANPQILPLFGDGAIEVYTLGSSEPITFSRAIPSVKQVSANVGFFPPELNDFLRREITNAGPQGEEKAFGAIVEGLINNPDRLTATNREDVTCGEVVCVDGIKDGKPARCIAEPSWNSGSFDPDAVTVDPLMVAVTRFLRGEVNTSGVISPEACFDPQSFFEELAKMAPIVSAQNGSFVRTRLESLP
jgi:saccharopine dehydrogenase-like NADP-dependent oxidoreductase